MSLHPAAASLRTKSNGAPDRAWKCNQSADLDARGSDLDVPSQVRRQSEMPAARAISLNCRTLKPFTALLELSASSAV